MAKCFIDTLILAKLKCLSRSHNVSYIFLKKHFSKHHPNLHEYIILISRSVYEYMYFMEQTAVWSWESYIISLSLSFLSVKGKHHHLPKCLTHKKMLNKLNIYFFTWFPCWLMSAMKVSGIYFFISTCNLCSGFLIWCQSYPK